MTFSEIHGKLTTIDSEDLLTSDIFGCCSFLGYHELLEPLLNEALHFSSKDKLCISEPVISDEYLFWPRFRIRKSQTEPDVFILLRHPGNKCTLVLIEAKYNSGKAAEADYSTEDITDQLARELTIIENKEICSQNLDLDGLEIVSKALIYVTADDVIPNKALEDSSYEFFEKGNSLRNGSYTKASELPLYWLPWWKIEHLIYRNSLTDLGEGTEKRIIKHVREVLRTKKLCRFYRVNPLHFNPIPYRFCTFEKEKRYSSKFRVPKINIPLQFGAYNMNNSEFTEQLDQSFKNLTSFFQELSSLMMECDRLMSEEGYTKFNGDTAVYEQSRLVYNPELWFPAYLSRMYVLEKQTKEKLYDHILFINVFFRYDPKVNRYITMVDNVPLIVAGLIVPNDPTVPINPDYKNNYYWIPGYWFNEKEIGKKNLLDENISETRVINPKSQGEYNNSRFIKTFAYPLEEIKEIKDLKTKIIEKLLEIAKNE